MTSTLVQKLDYFLSNFSMIHISTQIPMYEETDRLGRSSKVSGKRLQVPLVLAWALTMHK